MEASQRLIDQFNKNSMELIKIILDAWKDELYVDVRIWYLPEAGRSGAEVATKKGIKLRAEFLPRLIQALQQAQEEIDRIEQEAKSETVSVLGEQGSGSEAGGEGKNG
jgi:hypothetical protein